MTVYIADDEKNICTLLKRLIDWEGLNLSLAGEANDGRTAWAEILEIKPDIVIIDIKMPEMNGYEATSEIRKSSADIPIIAVTAYAFTEDEKRILENGFNGYLSKPIKAQTLLQKIKEFLN